VQGLDVREVETQDRKVKEKVWMNVAHFGEMVDCASAASLHLPLYRITLTIQNPKGVLGSRGDPAPLPEQPNFKHTAWADSRGVSISSSLLGMLPIAAGSAPAGLCDFWRLLAGPASWTRAEGWASAIGIVRRSVRSLMQLLLELSIPMPPRLRVPIRTKVCRVVRQ